MMNKLEEMAKNYLKDENTEYKLMDFIKSKTYLCKMFWLQRTDKLNESDYDLFIWITNKYAKLNKEDLLEKGYKPKYGNSPLFSGKYNYSDLINNIEQNMFKDLKLKILKEEKSESFFEKMTKIFKI